MQFLHTLPQSLLKLPFWLRLSSAIIVVALFLVLYILFFPIVQNPSVLVIPVIFSTWLFRRVGIFFSVTSIVGFIWAFLALHKHTFFLAFPIIMSMLSGTIALLLVGLLISAQRASFDLSEQIRQQLQQANKQQEQLHRLKDQFILSVNHELRTPLTAVYGYLELLLAHHEQMAQSQQKTFLRNALYSCEELQLLVNNVLDTMQIQHKKLSLATEKLSISQLVRETVIHVDPRRQQERVLYLNLPEQLSIYANAQYVRQVLLNLISNALKYAPVNTQVEVHAYLHPPDSQTTEQQMVCVSVCDQGPGIPAKELPLLFGQFFRLERDAASNVSGTGLGLYVSKQLVEAMGGQIWVESSGIVGEGSRFRFTLPYAGPPLTSLG